MAAYLVVTLVRCLVVISSPDQAALRPSEKRRQLGLNTLGLAESEMTARLHADQGRWRRESWGRPPRG